MQTFKGMRAFQDMDATGLAGQVTRWAAQAQADVTAWRALPPAWRWIDEMVLFVEVEAATGVALTRALTLVVAAPVAERPA